VTEGGRVRRCGKMYWRGFTNRVLGERYLKVQPTRHVKEYFSFIFFMSKSESPEGKKKRRREGEKKRRREGEKERRGLTNRRVLEGTAYYLLLSISKQVFKRMEGVDGS
jgi:hypothetical protein